jgi:dTDP-4-amino-4,6-dideoxygalactose transaminase
MVPSWTFAATGSAILLAGLVPWMVDVSGETWALEADAARELIARTDLIGSNEVLRTTLAELYPAVAAAESAAVVT